MADNFSFTEGSGKTGAADDIGGVLYPRVKIAQGADGSATDVSSAAPLQVSVANTGANGTAIVVDGSGVTQPVSHAALTELAAAIDTELQVDVVAALPAGTNNIGDVDIASIAAGDNNIGNVDVVTLPADPLGANADAAATAGSTGSISAKLRLITSQLDSIRTAVETIDNGISGNEMQVDVVGALPAGTNTIGKVNVLPETSGGLSIFRSIDLDESEEEVKASAGQVYGMWVSNTATSTRFVKFYNATAANVTVGTTTPVLTIAIPGNSSDDVTGFFSSAHGVSFDTAISVAATTGVADNDTGAPGANEIVINVFYK